MKKIIFIIGFLLICLAPLPVLALTDSQVTVPDVFIKKADIPPGENTGFNVPVKFTIKGSANELKEIKMIKLSVGQICPGTTGFALQVGDFQPAADDYSDGTIEGSLKYYPDSRYSCNGKRDIILYFCRQADNKCLYTATQTDILIDKITKKQVIEIGDNPPASASISPTDSASPADGGGGYDPLLPFKGKFSTFWDLLVRIVQILLGLAGVVAVAAMIIGGYQYMTSGGIPDKTQVAKSTLTYAIIGLLIVITALAVLHFVLPKLGVSSEVIWF